MRHLAVDFGERRIGLAISDPEGKHALPLTTILRRSDRQAVEEIVALTVREEVQRLIVGEPRTPDGAIGPATWRARRFAERLAAAAALPVEMVDECLSTVEAIDRLRSAGVDPRRHPERVDQVAAQLLLEEVLARRGLE